MLLLIVLKTKMKTYLIDSKVKIRGETYTIRFYDFFHYFFDGQTRSLLTSSFFTDLFPLTGFLTLKRFKKAIENYVLDDKQIMKDVSPGDVSLSEETVLMIKDEILKNLHVLRLKKRVIKIVLFPGFGIHFKRKFCGVSAYTVPSGKLFFIFLYKSFELNTKTEHELKKTVAHEFNHLVFEEHHKNWRGMIDNIVPEGLAGHFEIFINGRQPSAFFIKFSRQRCLQLWPRAKKILYSFDWEVYDNLFNHYNKIFPLGFGYSLGYQIVGDFLKKNKGLSWQKIMKMPSQEILEKSGWLNK